MHLMTYRVSRIACVVHSSCVRCSLFCAPSLMFVLLSLFLCRPRHHDSQANYQQLNSCYFFHHSFLLSQVQPRAGHQPSSHLRSLASLLFFPRQWLALLPQQTRYRRPQQLLFCPISWPSLIRLFRWCSGFAKTTRTCYRMSHLLPGASSSSAPSFLATWAGFQPSISSSSTSGRTIPLVVPTVVSTFNRPVLAIISSSGHVLSAFVQCQLLDGSAVRSRPRFFSRPAQTCFANTKWKSCQLVRAFSGKLGQL